MASPVRKKVKEVPLSEVIVPEAADYFVHFCGLECYEKWKTQRANGNDRAEKPRA